MNKNLNNWWPWSPANLVQQLKVKIVKSWKKSKHFTYDNLW